jgi:acetolactate synthase-1/2/3 large subunit
MSMEAVLAERLVAFGTCAAFGITGSGPSWKLITALETLDVGYLPAGHEAAAAIMAGGAWRATGRPAVSVGIKGPGLANMLAGIAFNNFENLPVISACEAYGRSSPPERMHKRMNQSALLTSVCKGSIGIAEAPERLSALVDLANQEVPGPVHVDLCADPVDSVPWRLVPPPPEDGAARSAALRLLDSARRPIVVVGSLALRRDWSRTLGSLPVPVFTTAAAKGAVDESAPSSLGVFTGDGKASTPEAEAFADCDLVVGLGLRNLEVLSPRAFRAPLLSLDEVGPEHSRGFEPRLTYQTWDAAAYGEVLALLSGRPWGADLAGATRQRLTAALAPSDAWLPPACFTALNALGGAYSLAVDTGNFCTIAEHCWLASPARRFLGSSNGRFMGGSIPTAIGAAVADRQTAVFCVFGDGGIRMYLGEIALAIRHRLPICFVLMSDGRFGSVAGASRGPGLSTAAVSTPRASWLDAVAGLGCEVVAPDNPAAFEAAVGSWRRTEPFYVECSFDPERCARIADVLR